MKAEHYLAICKQLAKHPEATQRELSVETGFSLGLVNGVLKKCLSAGYFQQEGDRKLLLTEAGQAHLEQYRVKNGILLAAGFGSRCIPLTHEIPKGLLKVHGKPMIERQIEQLLEKGITEIIVVVGYQKERFDYLIDRYGAKLVYNPEYATKNNLASLYYALPWLDSSYVLVSDNWMEENIFHTYEARSWVSCLYFDGPTDEWCVTVSSNDKIQSISIGGQAAWGLVGPAYFSSSFSARYKRYLCEYYNRPGTADYFWEYILKEHLDSLPMYINRQTGNVHEFENLEELRRFDLSYSKASNNKIMEAIAKRCFVSKDQIQDLRPIKEGQTNSSFRFSIGGETFVYRIPRAGTHALIDRENEKAVYDAIGKLGITDEVVGFDVASGAKISRFIKDAREANPFCDDELKICMEQIRKIHQSGISARASYDIEKAIDHYVSLAESLDAIRFPDIHETKEKVRHLLRIRRHLAVPDVLCNGDYAHVNVLVCADGSRRIVDWERSGMGDPIMDIAMYGIFAGFDQERVDLSLRVYCGRNPSPDEWIRLYLYVALSGFLWCMWSQYEQALGQEFGEYPLTMYRYMKDYYPRTIERIGSS